MNSEKKKITCVCGCVIEFYSLKKHCKTKKHYDLLKAVLYPKKKEYSNDEIRNIIKKEKNIEPE